MGKAAWAWAGLALVVCVASPRAWAVERELAGVRLGDRALELLDRPGYGEPDFIGPLGAVSQASEPERGVRAAGGGVGRSGPAGPSGGRAGARGGGSRAAGRGMAARGMRGGRGATAGGGAGRRTRTGGAGAVAERGMYWYYRRSGGAVVLLSLDLKGEVKAITLIGNMPYEAGRTTRAIGLTSGYMEIITQYGYPDQVVSGGTVLELTYVDHGVRFTLDAMRVAEIAIGAHIAAAAEAAPVVGPEPPPPAGMSVEELRGYL